MGHTVASLSQRMLVGSLFLFSLAPALSFACGTRCSCRREGSGSRQFLSSPYSDCKPCNKDDLKTDIFGPPCCPVPPGEIMQKSEILESQPGCGESVIDRIIGGEAAEGREVPWMCAILRSDNRWRGCGAALLSCNPPV